MPSPKHGVLKSGGWAVVVGYVALILLLVGLAYLGYLSLTQDRAGDYGNIQKLRGDAALAVALAC